ncbi:hypothetical protein CLI71_11320 [Prevotella intermedia]|uniref:Uncharacterized protein n=1 Tax=Prevotella intermedia TaxID=28131 RepID=A0A2A6ECW8_PREIN|nr:hypothetical protein CLI71_11320 [Prevotella intermedia]
MGWGGATFLTAENEQVYLEILGKLELSRISTTEVENSFSSVKIIHRENANFDLALRKRLFWTAKEPLLPCKTYAFGTQNNRFYNALITSELHNRYTCEKYLHLYCLFFAYIIRWASLAFLAQNRNQSNEKRHSNTYWNAFFTYTILLFRLLIGV